MDFFRPAQPSLLDRAWLMVRYPYDIVRNPLDAFLSIPALSFLIIPTFSSYSTSLNLLFFYLTWSTLILSNSPLKVEIFGTIAIRVLFYILPSVVFLTFDSAVPKIAVGIKEHGEDALPQGDKPEGRKSRCWKISLVSASNVLLGIALQVGIEVLFTQILHVRSALKITTSIPLPWSIAFDLVKGLLLRELLTYVLHRYVLHNSSSPLTDYHVNWQHSVSTPYSMVANYDHPIAYVVHVFLPAYLPAMLFRFHLLTYHLYLAIVSLEETFAYSGYNVLPSGLILGGIARRQERHLMKNGAGNFGCFGALDFALGTSLGQDVVEDVTQEVQEAIHNERGKSKENASPKKTSRGRKPRKPHAEDRDEHEDEDPTKRLSRGRRLKEPRVGNEDVEEEEEAHQRNEEAESPKRRTGRPRKERS
ncbi:MAG: hypothetical protein HETSPECPRED_009955 [Heterodermia speciosa]|uniref:Fatty acid hydroxylase domain-containing protein n=1 Tax=Heterodermia speciosa TaxID=116794 RepID=A0A8H3G7F9_9LECA|nr:MAG: hypothetical protein HETSPECPRED_009955 [Heterodermia speciosa]